MVSPRKKRLVVRQLRSGSKAPSDSPEDWVSASDFQFKESPKPVKRDTQRSSRVQSSVLSKGRRQSHILKRLDASVLLTSPYSHRRTRRQSMFITSESVETNKISLSKRTSPVMKAQKPPIKESHLQKATSPKRTATSESSFISPVKFYSSPKAKETRTATRQTSSRQLPTKRKIETDVIVLEVESSPKKLKESPVVSKNAKKRSPSKIDESKATKSPQAKKKLRSAIPKKITSPKAKASIRANEKSPTVLKKLRSNDSKSTEISVVSNVQKKPNNSPIKGKGVSKTKISPPKSPKKDHPTVASPVNKTKVSVNKVKTPAKETKRLSPESKKKSPKHPTPKSIKKEKTPKNPTPKSIKKEKTPKPQSPKLRSRKSPASGDKKLSLGKKDAASPRKTSSPQSKVKLPKKQSPKTPNSSSGVKKSAKIRAPYSLTRLGSSPSLAKVTRSSSRSARKVTLVGQSPKTSGSSFRKTPLSKQSIKKDTDVNNGASPQLSARTQLEIIRSRSPLRSALGSRSATKVKPFTPKPDSPPSNVLKKTMKKKIAQKMHATTKVEVHQLLNGEISKPVSMVNGRKTMTASITVTQTKRSNIAVTPRKPISSDLLDGIVIATTPVSASNLPPTPTSSRKLSDSVNSVRSYKSHSTTSASCQRSLLATIPRSSTPIEDDDDKINPISVDAIVSKEDNFMDSSINTDQSEDNNSLIEAPEQKPVSPEKTKRSYCSLM